MPCGVPDDGFPNADRVMAGPAPVQALSPSGPAVQLAEERVVALNRAWEQIRDGAAHAHSHL